MHKLTIPTLAAFVVSLASSAPADAKPRNQEQQEEVNKQSVALKNLEVRDKKNVATAEIGTAQAWLKEADRYAQRRRTRDDFRNTMDRVASMVVLVDALLTKSGAEAKAEAAEASAESAESELRRTSKKADELEARKTELEGTVTR